MDFGEGLELYLICGKVTKRVSHADSKLEIY